MHYMHYKDYIHHGLAAEKTPPPLPQGGGTIWLGGGGVGVPAHIYIYIYTHKWGCGALQSFGMPASGSLKSISISTCLDTLGGACGAIQPIFHESSTSHLQWLRGSIFPAPQTQDPRACAAFSAEGMAEMAEMAQNSAGKPPLFPELPASQCQVCDRLCHKQTLEADGSELKSVSANLSVSESQEEASWKSAASTFLQNLQQHRPEPRHATTWGPLRHHLLWWRR